MYKLEELSIADLKAVYDYAQQELDHYDNIPGYAKDVDKQDEEIEHWFDIKESAEILLEARINIIFKP